MMEYKTIYSIIMIKGDDYMSFCKKCGAEYQPGQKYCANCGNELFDKNQVANPDSKQSTHRNKANNKFSSNQKVIIGLIVTVMCVIGIINFFSSLNNSISLASNNSNSNSSLDKNIESPKVEDSKTNTASDTSKQPKPTEVKKEEPKKEEVLKVSAVDLASAYEENEVKADKDFKGKTIETSGIINNIGVTFGETYIVLSSGKDFSITDVQCFFNDKSEIDKIVNLKKGDTVTIIGVVDGKSLNVGVNKCKFK